MSLKTLPWCPQPGYSVEEEPRRKVLNFGNGYQQRIESGINTLLRKYSVTFKIRHNESVQFRNFMKEHGGIRAFYFRDVALGGELVKVICTKFPRSITKTHTTFNCEFEEVV
ncbi:phage tail protein [Pasteurellaceae bacterium Macca]|nr:phage tail protein [Pasteurellaceae bacterium Macca]MCK3656447.1 phage tail protein [Pasteurellaceae bacterium Macca]MCK3656742.1 phage tail protein [Pasteurellaceae bacterium Macca]MCK3657084.1 phage tail protein [Pasteurellaceae bacterium Macca]